MSLCTTQDQKCKTAPAPHSSPNSWRTSTPPPFPQHQNEGGSKIPIHAFEQQLLDCFCTNKIAGFEALSNSLIDIPGLEQYASASNSAMSAWLLALEAIHAAAKH